MAVFDLIRVLSLHKFILIGIFSTIVGVGMVVTFLLPPTYQSEMKILITRERMDPQITPAERPSDYSRGGLSDEDFNSEIEILQSRAVLEGVARQTGLDKQYSEAPRSWFARLRSHLSNYYRSFHGQTTPDAMEIAVLRLRENLEAVSVKKSRVIKVAYKDSNPERAAQVLNELYRQYAEHHLRLLQSSKVANVFHEQSEAFSQKLKEVTDKLKRFDSQTGVIGSAAQQELLLRRYYETRNQLDNTVAEIRETEQRIGTLKAQLETQPERIESEARTKYVLALDKIKEEILTLELQRTQLMQKYQPNHRLVKEVEERLAQAREAQAREEKSPPQERATALNEIHRRLTSELLLAQANLTTLRERERTLGKLAQQYKEQLSIFDAKSLERDDLERMRAVNEEAYLLYRKKAQETDIINALNQERIVNFLLAEPPGVNRRPVSPKPLVNLLALMLIGLVAAVAAVAFLERNRLRLSGASLPMMSGAETPLLSEGPNAPLSSHRPLLLSNNPPERNGNYAKSAQASSEQSKPDSILDKALNGNAEHEELPPQVPTAFESNFVGAQRRSHFSQNGVAEHKPEMWRVAAVVDYLRAAYHLPPDKLSEFLLETAGWKVSPEEVDEILSRAEARKNG